VNFLDGFSRNTQDLKFHENPSSGIRVVPWEWTEMLKLVVAFRYFAIPPEVAELDFASSVNMLRGVA
jgi:hypothetical protein